MAAVPPSLSGGACSWRLAHVSQLADTAAVPASSRHVTSVLRAPLYTSIHTHVVSWLICDAAHRTLHSPLPLLPASAKGVTADTVDRARTREGYDHRPRLDAATNLWKPTLISPTSVNGMTA